MINIEKISQILGNIFAHITDLFLIRRLLEKKYIKKV